MKSGFLACLLSSTSVAIASGPATEVLPLSGMGNPDEAPVYWDFQLDTGRGSGVWRKIVVPSQWEQQGFGTYYYGTQGRGKPDDDPVIPKETGTYRRSFELPESWRGRDLHLVFEAAMTDTSVWINGKSAGPAHQGGFYRFSYDISNLLKPGTNQIEVKVAKESANTSVNRAERRGFDVLRLGHRHHFPAAHRSRGARTGPGNATRCRGSGPRGPLGITELSA